MNIRGLQIILFLVLNVKFLAAQFRQINRDTVSVFVHTDSINGAILLIKTEYKQLAKSHEVKEIKKVFTKDSILIYEEINKTTGIGCILHTEFALITIYDEKRNYRTRAYIKPNSYRVKKYNSGGTLLSDKKYDLFELEDEWDAGNYLGESIQERSEYDMVKYKKVIEKAKARSKQKNKN